MQRIYASLAGVALITFVASCDTDRITSPREDAVSVANVTMSSRSCASYTQIVALAEVVFAPKASEVTGKLDNIRKQLADGHVSNARVKGMELIDFILKKKAQNQVAGSQAQVTQLVNDILCWLGITGSIPAAGDAYVVDPGSTTSVTLVNTEKNAGVVLPPGSVSEPTIITIAPITWTSTVKGSGPLITKLDQYPGFFHISKISATDAPFLKPVVVAVCPSPSVPVSIRQKLRLGHQAASGFELPPPANASFLSCPVTAPALMAPTTTQSEGYTLVRKRDAAIELGLDATGGVGGTTGTFSDFGTVDGTLSATGGVGGTTGTFIRMGESQTSLMFDGRPHVVAPCTEAPLGSAVPAECRPTVSITTALGTKLQNVPVTFAVTQGNGTVAPQTLAACGAFNSSVTVTTSNFGIAVACWTLGASAGVNSVTATPATGGDVPPSAVFVPATLVFTMNGVDNTAPVIADPVVTGVKGLDDWYTSDVSVSWQVSDPESAVTTEGCSASLTSDNAGITYTCSARNAVGLTSSRSVTVKRDASTPTGLASVTGKEGIDNWFISNVAVTWALTPHGPSGLGASAGCTNTSVISDGDFSFTCTPKSGAGLSGANITAAGKRDASTPAVSVALNGTKGSNDWYVTDVAIGWTLSAHGPSGLGAVDGCTNTLVITDGAFSYSCRVVSGAGVSSQFVTTSGQRDASIPTGSVSVTGEKGLDGWFIGNVAVTWTLTPHGPSGLGASEDCTDRLVNSDGAFSFTCTPKSGAGLSGASITAAGKRDASIPTVSVATGGTKGSNDWYVTDVPIDWTRTANGPSGLSEPGPLDGCTNTVVKTDGEFSSSCKAVSGAGVSSQIVTSSGKRDASIPTGSVSVTGQKGLDNWFISNVAVTWNLTPHGPSGLGASEGCDNTSVSSDGDFSFTCTPKSGAGLSGANITAAGKRDASIPTVSVDQNGTKGSLDWYVTDVAIDWALTAHGPSRLGPAVGCTNTVVNTDGEFSYSCKAVSGAGISSEIVTTSGKRDASIPTGSVSVTGQKGLDNWFISNVAVTWNLTPHGPSGLGASEGCDNTSVSSDGDFSFTCTPKSGAGLSGASIAAAGKRDASIPTVGVSVNGTKGSNDWYVTDVGIVWTRTPHGPSGLSLPGAFDGCTNTVVNTDGEFSYSCKAVSGAGVSSQIFTTSGKRDVTGPTVTYLGNSGTYGVDGVVAISCRAADATSGVASTTCANIQGDAYSFDIGLNSYSASATDYAGNTGVGATSFTVVLTSANLCALARRFSAASGVSNSLCGKLDNIGKAAARGDANAKSGMVNAFINEVNAQTGKALDSTEAGVLIRLVKLL